MKAEKIGKGGDLAKEDPMLSMLRSSPFPRQKGLVAVLAFAALAVGCEGGTIDNWARTWGSTVRWPPLPLQSSFPSLSLVVTLTLVLKIDPLRAGGVPLALGGGGGAGRIAS